MVWRNLLVGFLAVILGSVLIGLLEMGPPLAIVLMPGVGFLIGYCLKAATDMPSRIQLPLAALAAYSAAMFSHLPAAWDLFRHDFGLAPMRSAFQSLDTCIGYPLQAMRVSPFYGVMLGVSIMAAMAACWRRRARVRATPRG